jgi:hypothetical protein
LGPLLRIGYCCGVAVDTDVLLRTHPAIGEFSLFLPVGDGCPTHVVELSGNQLQFRRALATAIESGGEEMQPLLLPVGATPLGKLADILNALGEASVQSIDPVLERA